MSREVHVNVDGVVVTVNVPDTATVVRAVVVLSTERMDDDSLVAGAYWGSSSMDGDHLVGMVTRAQRAITRDLERETR